MQQEKQRTSKAYIKAHILQYIFCKNYAEAVIIHTHLPQWWRPWPAAPTTLETSAWSSRPREVPLHCA